MFRGQKHADPKFILGVCGEKITTLCLQSLGFYRIMVSICVYLADRL